MTAPENRKRFSLEEIAELLGRNTDQRLIAALLRKKAGKVVSITPEQITMALAFLEGEQHTGGAYQCFARLCRKWLGESKKAHMALTTYARKLQTAAATEGQPERKVTRGRKKQP